ncbi:hypothetical protein EDC01DRAFT_789395 [Geopyxis carbonaria]|nr:hypothetical protein EDC01DRAFT_789395 [Geopyxis carbonaria]
MRTYLAPIIGAILAAFITAILAYGLYQWYRRVRLRRNQPVPVAVPVEAAQPVDVALIVQGDMVREGGEFFQPVATAAAAETGGGQGEYFAPRAGPVRLPRIVQAPVPAAVYRYVESQTGWWGRRRWAAVQMGQWALEALGLMPSDLAENFLDLAIDNTVGTREPVDTPMTDAPPLPAEDVEMKEAPPASKKGPNPREDYRDPKPESESGSSSPER